MIGGRRLKTDCNGFAWTARIQPVPSQRVVTWGDETPKSVSITCGYCRIAVEANLVSEAHEVERSDSGPGGAQRVRVVASYACPRPTCGNFSLVFLEFSVGRGYSGLKGIVGQLPRGNAQPMDGLPSEIAADRDEAWSCLYGGDVRASIIMGRAAIQRAVRKLGAEGAGLKAEIADLLSKGEINKSLKEWADEVRIAGDEAAHPEALGEVTRGEAEASLEFMDAFLEGAIALPAKAEARKLARKELKDA